RRRPATRSCTPATSRLLRAGPLTVRERDSAAPDAGALMLTAGGVVSAFDTVTLTGDEVVRFPAASRAAAVRVCEPLPTVVVFQDTEYGDAVSSPPRLAPSSEECSVGTARLSEAEALTVTVPDTVAPDAGALMLTAGGVVSAFDTVMLTGDEVVRFPAASRAVAVRVCEPLPTVVVFQDTEYGDAVSSPPRLAPSTWNCTPATPTLPEAVALTVTVPDTDTPDPGALMLTAGGVVSAFDTEALTADEVVRCPAARPAAPARVREPLPTVLFPYATLFRSAVSSPPRLAPSTRNCTPATPTLSEAEALTVTVPDTVAPDAGALMLTAGGVVSAF